MKHPTPEEFASLLYSDGAPEEISQTAAHVASCAECRRKMEEMTGTQTRLNNWILPSQLPTPKPRERSTVIVGLFEKPWLRWAAVLAAVLTLGYYAGTKSRPGIDVQALAKELEPQLRAQILAEAKQQNQTTLTTLAQQNREMLESFAQVVATGRAEDRDRVMGALQQIEARRLQEYKSVRRDLETVALNTQASLSETQNGLIRLASSTPSVRKDPN